MVSDIGAVVAAARDGDVNAWVELVERFEDFAVAVAVGRVGDLDSARDVAQEAFLLAFRSLDRLRDPEAFAGWFATLIRTACARHVRRAGAAPLGVSQKNAQADVDAGPANAVIAAEQAEMVRGAVEALPERERSVIALHYLADLPYAEVGALLGISESTARKRAFSARARIKEMLVMTPEAMSGLKPSRTHELRDTVMLFAAIRRRDHAAVYRLLDARPELVHALESWSWSEAIGAGLHNAEDGTPLIRAVETGDLAIVEMLLNAGAPVDARCRCAGAETPLWTAVSLGYADIVERLLAVGADPNASAFAGATPLHVAAHTHPELAERLLRAGADPDRSDRRGRTVRDWAQLGHPATRRSTADGASRLETGIRALDLFAPLQRGTVQYWPPALELGQTVLLYELIDALSPARAWWLGFAYGPYDHTSLDAASRQWGVPVHCRLAPEQAPAAERRERFADALAALHAGAHEKLVICLSPPGFRHDITAAIPRLTSDPRVLATIVVEPLPDEQPAAVNDTPPEGFDAQVSLDPIRARRRLYPAIDPAKTLGKYPDDAHARLAGEARRLLSAYRQLDPTLALPDPSTLSDPTTGTRAQHLLRYLAQPFTIYEPFSSIPGQSTPISETLATVSRRLST